MKNLCPSLVRDLSMAFQIGNMPLRLHFVSRYSGTVQALESGSSEGVGLLAYSSVTGYGDGGFPGYGKRSAFFDAAMTGALFPAKVDAKRGLVLTDRHSAPQSLGATEAGCQGMPRDDGSWAAGMDSRTHQISKCCIRWHQMATSAFALCGTASGPNCQVTLGGCATVDAEVSAESHLSLLVTRDRAIKCHQYVEFRSCSSILSTTLSGAENLQTCSGSKDEFGHAMFIDFLRI